MQKKHIFIYSLLILSLIVLTSFFLYNYKSKTKIKIKIYEKEEAKELSLKKTDKYSDKKVNNSNNVVSESTLIENIEYNAIDTAGNKFEIKAAEGKTDARNYNKLSLIGVNAKIQLLNSEIITITSDFADYNKSTVETIFNKNVKINYINHKVESEKLHLSFEDKLANITENVIYNNGTTKMITDNIKIDFRKRSTKIFMNNENEKVFVKSTY
tara:strand:- start:287 stop:925 length:639 start_codon:yes stop_codon:yes gene_type:complete